MQWITNKKTTVREHTDSYGMLPIDPTPALKTGQLRNGDHPVQQILTCPSRRRSSLASGQRALESGYWSLILHTAQLATLPTANATDTIVRLWCCQQIRRGDRNRNQARRSRRGASCTGLGLPQSWHSILRFTYLGLALELVFIEFFLYLFELLQYRGPLVVLLPTLGMGTWWASLQTGASTRDGSGQRALGSRC